MRSPQDSRARLVHGETSEGSRSKVRGFPNFEPRTTNFGSRLSPPSRASLATVCAAGGLFQHPASLEGVLRDSVPAGGGGRWIHVRL